MSAPGPEAVAQYGPDGTCRACGKFVHDGARALHPRYCTAKPAGTAPGAAGRPAPAPVATPATDGQYRPDGTCRGCGKFVHDGARALHPRYCTAKPTGAEPGLPALAAGAPAVSLRKGAGTPVPPAVDAPVRPESSPSPAPPSPQAGATKGIAMLVGAVAVFVICSLIQAAGGSSMFSTSYSESNSAVLDLLVNVTFWPGWLATAALVVGGVKELADSS